MDPGTGLEIELTTRDREVTVAAKGEIDIDSCPELLAVLTGAIEGGVPVVRVDLSDVSFFGSIGIRCLVESSGFASERGVRLVVRPSEVVLRIVEIAGLAEILELER